MFKDMSFEGCSSLALLTFESPSLLQTFSGCVAESAARIDVPNSVKYVSCRWMSEGDKPLVLDFGAESELERFHFHNFYPYHFGVFVRFSERSLRRLRSRLELSDACDEIEMIFLRGETEDIIASSMMANMTLREDAD
jgi:hypothetical protein